MLADEHREVLTALRTLPARQREVIVLRYWSQLGEAEIAATLGISIGAVNSSASRGRDAIAATLDDSQRGQHERHRRAHHRGAERGGRHRQRTRPAC